MDFQARRDRLRKAFKKSGIDALLVTDFINVTYLTGFTGDDSYFVSMNGGQFRDREGYQRGLPPERGKLLGGQ